MAKSLVCKDCNTLLRSVQEAQQHNEVTGHANFEESLEVVKIVACTSCGKPCRTDAERDMHTRFTGHTEFVDKTDAEGTLNTEQEMKSARTTMDTDDDLLRASLGKPPKAKPAAQSDGEGASTQELEPAVVDPELLKEMEAMGFPTNRSIRAIHFSRATTSVEAAVNWVVEHEGDMDIDEPLMITKEAAAEAAAVSNLTPEEARAKAEELVRKARERREKEERESEKVRELERIRAGKEMQKARAKEDEMSLKRAAEQKKREKDADAKYKEALRARLEEDRKERRRKLGLPEELTEEEKAREAEKLRKQQEEEASKKVVFGYVKPASVIATLRAKLVAVKKANTDKEEQFKTACSTMIKYIGNIHSNPNEEKFRTIKLSNAAFQQRVASVAGTIEFLEVCGFKRGDDVLTMPQDKANVDVLEAAGSALNEAISNPFFGAL